MSSNQYPEITIKALFLGVVLSMILAGANAYLGLFAGMTVSASIPAAVISMGVYIGASTKIVDRTTGEVTYGKVPAYSVVVPGSMPNKTNPDGPSLYCAVIVKKVDSKTRSKTSINDLLSTNISKNLY